MMYLPNRDFCDVDFSACCMYLFGETKIFISFSALLKSHSGFEQCLLATKKSFIQGPSVIVICILTYPYVFLLNVISMFAP